MLVVSISKSQIIKKWYKKEQVKSKLQKRVIYLIETATWLKFSSSISKLDKGEEKKEKKGVLVVSISKSQIIKKWGKKEQVKSKLQKYVIYLIETATWLKFSSSISELIMMSITNIYKKS